MNNVYQLPMNYRTPAGKDDARTLLEYWFLEEEEDLDEMLPEAETMLESMTQKDHELLLCRVREELFEFETG